MDNDGDYLCGASEFFNLAKHNLQFNGKIKARIDFDFRIPIAYCLHCNAYLEELCNCLILVLFILAYLLVATFDSYVQMFFCSSFPFEYTTASDHVD